MAGNPGNTISGRLVRNFALTGGLVVLLAMGFVGVVQYHLTDREISAEAERYNEALAGTLSILIADEIEKMLAMEKSGGNAAPVDAALFGALNHAFVMLGSETRVLKVKLYDVKGTVIYSTYRPDIGDTRYDNSAFRRALDRHETASERSFRPAFNAIGGLVSDRYVLSSYLPIFIDQSRQKLGAVFEIYSDVTEPVSALYRTLGIEFVIALFLVGMAYAVQLLIVFRGAREIDLAHKEKIELAAAMADIDAASQAKSNFLMSMSHELKTPLNAILGFSEIIKDQRFGSINDQRYRNYADEIHRAGAHLLKSVEDILDLTRLESAQMKLNVEPTDPANILISVAKEMAQMASDGNVHLRILPAGNMPPIQVDSRRVRQILRNLLDNAVKFSRPNSEVELSVTTADPDGTVEFRVADKGRGMAKEQIPEKTIPFGAKRDVLTQQTGGLGLGLPLSQRLAHLMGALLVIDSTPCKGTIVRLRLRADGQNVAKSA